MSAVLPSRHDHSATTRFAALRAECSCGATWVLDRDGRWRCVESGVDRPTRSLPGLQTRR